MADDQKNESARRSGFDDEYIEDVAARYSQKRWSGEYVNLSVEVQNAREEVRPALLAKLLITEQGWRRKKKRPLLTQLKYLQANPALASLLPAAYAALPEHLLVPARFGDYITESHLRKSTQGDIAIAVDGRDSAAQKTRYAIKYSAQAPEIQSLEKERDLLSQLPDGIAVKVIDWGIAMQGNSKRGYLVLEYLSGGSLRARGKQISGDPVMAAVVVSQLAKSMQVLHSRNISHRDVKPENIVADHNGTYLFIDLGHACEFERFGGGEQEVDDHSGTYEYMSPQQQAKQSDENRVSSDIYSLGGVLYFLLTGNDPEPPYSESKIESEDFTKPWRPDLLEYEELPWRPREICFRAMRLEEESRFQSADSFAGALDRWLFWRRQRVPIAAAGAITLLLVIAGLSLALRPASRAVPTRSPSATPSPALPTTAVMPAPAPQVRAQESWITSLLQEHGMSEGDITKDNFDVGFELDPRDTSYSSSKPVYLRVALNGLPEDLLAGVEYRFGKRAWSNLSGWTVAGSYRSLISPELHTSEEPLQIQLDSVREYQQGQTIGPFTFDIDIQGEMQKHARARAEEFVKATTGKWLTKKGDTWLFTDDFLDKHLPHIHMLWGGTSQDALQPYHRDAWRSPGAMRTQATHFLNSLQQPFSFRQSRERGDLKFYLQLEGHDGQRSKVRSFSVPRSKTGSPRVPASGGFGGGGFR